MASAGLLDRAAAPFDHLRQATLAAALRVPALASVLARRDRRIALMATLGIALALPLTIVAPVFLFMVGPVVFGVAHVASDLRYLVLRRNLAGAWRNAVLAGCALLFALRVLEETFHPRALPRLEMIAVSAWMAAGAFAAARSPRARRRLWIALPFLGALAASAIAYPVTARLVFVHVHNLVGVALWILLFRTRGRGAALPVAWVLLATAGLVAFWLYPLTTRAGGELAFGIHFLAITDWVAPGLPVRAAVALTYAYVFLQSVHYSVWLGWIPQEDVRAQGTLTFRMSARALSRDFGVPALVAIAAGAAAVLGGALVDLNRTRSLYLSLAMFHGYLEVAMLAYFVVRGSAPAPEAG